MYMFSELISVALGEKCFAENRVVADNVRAARTHIVRALRV